MSKFNDESSPRAKYNPKKKPMREIEFINIHLTDADEAPLKKQRDLHAKMVIDPLDGILMAGYKVSMSVDYENECYIVSTTGGERTVNADKCVSSRSDDLYEAVAIAFYKIFGENGEVAWETKPKRYNRG